MDFKQTKEMNEQDYSEDWIRDSIKYWDKVLIGNKSHWCYEWDDLPIDETCKEYESCICDLWE